jgi:diguanylate cyclase (GGDEF)-like protein
MSNNSCDAIFEDQRLAALKDYDVLDTQPEESFDRITRLVRLTMGTPIAVVSLVDRNRQWFKSRDGTDVEETPRDISFCTHTIKKSEPLVITNALDDPRFCSSPLVTCENGIRFYVGIPLRSPSGFNIGALCAIDTKPREVSAVQIKVMQDLARLVMDELELRKLATQDTLTGAMTRRAFTLESVKEFSKAERHDRALSCIAFDLDHFKQVNDIFGHAAGDHVLRSVVEVCSNALRAGDWIGRFGGEEFCIGLPETSLEGGAELAERLRRGIEIREIVFAGARIPVTASFGVTACSAVDASFDDVRMRADEFLYRAKALGRNRVEVETRAAPIATSEGIPAHAA